MKEKVKAYIREKIPELGETCPSPSPFDACGQGICSHNPKEPLLQHYLRVLGDGYTIGSNGGSYKYRKGTLLQYEPTLINFNLTTGEPDTPEDWQKLADILGIK